MKSESGAQFKKRPFPQILQLGDVVSVIHVEKSIVVPQDTCAAPSALSGSHNNIQCHQYKAQNISHYLHQSNKITIEGFTMTLT